MVVIMAGIEYDGDQEDGDKEYEGGGECDSAKAADDVVRVPLPWLSDTDRSDQRCPLIRHLARPVRGRRLVCCVELAL